MKLTTIGIASLTIMLIASCTSKQEQQADQEEATSTDPKVEFVKDEAENKVDVMVDGKLFTTYRWPDNVYKPILYPILTSAGTAITRGFPLEPRPGERSDHRHQVGNWLNYGNVNGYDFWGNGSTGERDVKNGGQIKHKSIETVSGGAGEGTMVTTASWVDPAAKELMSEKTTYHFIAKGPVRIIDRIETLTNTSGAPVSFKDTKEGMFGIRVARQLELPSKEDVVLTDAQGNPTTVKKMSNEGVSGNYRSSEGVTGEDVWSTRAKWMDLYGNIGDEKISVVICDHPDNISYPTYWHARGYGLFSANPFGAKDFTKGKEEINYTLAAGDSLTFKYRIVVSSGSHLTDDEINTYANEFAAKY
jgi:hypothetical protein